MPRAGRKGRHLNSLAIGGLQDVAAAHALAVDHVLAGRADDVNLDAHQGVNIWTVR